LLFSLIILPLTFSAQRTVSGRITDTGDGEPIPGASVFIANTTVGMTTDSEGRYKLAIPGVGSYRLAVSHASYQPVFKDIELGKTSVVMNITLHIRELEEVTVSAKVKFRKEDIALFWNTLLGKDPSKKTIYATNPEAPFYYYDFKTKILKVTCRTPLRIINNETGYEIQYILSKFVHNYDTNTTSWNGEFSFKELEPENARQENLWGKNREKIYKISIATFIKALYHNSLLENGFLLTYTGGVSRYLSELKTADSPSTYSVVIEGVTNNGKIIYKRDKIVVKKGETVLLPN